MLKKDKLEEDYQNIIKNIERMAAEEIKKIRERANALKEEAAKIGEAVELSPNEKETETTTKKVNT